MIGMNIQSRRKMCGLTQEQLAECLGVSRQTVAKWESGETTPDLSNGAALADALDVSLDALIRYDSHGTSLPMPPRARSNRHTEAGARYLRYRARRFSSGIRRRSAGDRDNEGGRFHGSRFGAPRAIREKTVTARLPSWVLHAVARKEMPCGKQAGKGRSA